jgi:tetratricopeptide (TPR) repeat protein
MSRLLLKRPGCTCAVILLAVVAAGCGGAESRKAKHVQKGDAFLAAGNLEKARVEFRNALQIAPTDSQVRYDNGVVDEKLGNMREAAQFYQGAIDTNADNVRARASLGRLYLFSGAPEQALATVKPSMAAHPEDAGLLTVRAAARIQLKDTGGALADAEHAVRVDPANEDAVAVLAGIYKNQGNADKAQALLEDSVKRHPGTVDLRLALAQLYAGLGQEPKVEALLIDLVRLQPGEKAHRLRLAQYYARLNHDDEAEQVLRQGVKDLPNERDLKAGLVQFLAARRSRPAAEKEISALIAADPKDTDLKFALGQFYEQGREFAKAEAVYQGVIAAAGADGPGITARNRLAALRVGQNDAPGAEKLLAEVLSKNPRDNDALILRGNLALAQKDPKTAIADLRAVLRDQPNAVGVMRALARAHLANGEPALAEETMRRALDANPKDANVRVDLAELLTKVGKPEQAKPVIDELVKQQPNNIAALDVQFRVAVANKDIASAKTAADAIVTLQPDRSLGYFYQGSVAEAQKRPAEAVALYSKAMQLAPDALEPMQGLVHALVGMNRLPDALKRLDEVIARDPKNALAENLKGELLLGVQQRPADAAAAFHLAIDRNPLWWLPYRNLALAQMSSHDVDGAIAALQSGMGKAQDPAPLEGELAQLYERLGKVDDAARVYEATLRRDPRSELAANNLAMLLITYKKDQASLDRAKALTQRFAGSPNAAFLDTYGWVLYKRGEGAAAVATLQNSSAKAPNSPVFLYHLGMAQALAGQSDAARDTLAQALKSGANFAGKDEAQATLDKLAKLAPPGSAQPKS